VYLSKRGSFQTDRFALQGDGTTTTVLFTGELLRQAERYVSEGVHPRIISEGFEVARTKAAEFLESFQTSIPKIADDRDLLASVARTSLRTKLHHEMADQLTDAVTDAVLTVRREGEPVDLFMVEIMHMQHEFDNDSRLVRGIVMDHGARHPDMPKRLENCYVLTCNIGMEYEKTEVAASFVYSTAEERDKMVEAERKHVDDRVKQIIALKREVCPPGSGKNFVILNQKGIDPVSLDMLAKENILALRRAKRRNMERLTLACGGIPVNSTDDLTADMLGYAGLVYEETLGDDKYTFVEDVKNPQSCTILIKGPNPHTIAQLKDAVRDGLRAVRNAVEDEALIPGAGSFEVACARHLTEFIASGGVTGKAKLGVAAFAEAMLIVPKTLADNSGFDVSDTLIKVQEASAAASPAPVGLDVVSGEPMDPAVAGIWDNLRVKRQCLGLSQVLASQLLLVDEVLRAGRGSRT
jgi:T-complex protein 1 subunit zeta